MTQGKKLMNFGLCMQYCWKLNKKKKPRGNQKKQGRLIIATSIVMWDFCVFFPFIFSFSFPSQLFFFLVINSSFTSDHLLLKFAPFGERYIFKALHKFMVYTTLK